MEELSAPLQTVCRLFEQTKQQGEGSRFGDSEHFEALLGNATVREQARLRHLLNLKMLEMEMLKSC